MLHSSTESFKNRFKTYTNFKSHLNKSCSFKTGLMNMLSTLDDLETPGFEAAPVHEEDGLQSSNVRMRGARNMFTTSPNPASDNMEGHAISLLKDRGPGRCIVCCELCKQGKNHSSRKGCRTKYGCYKCAVPYERQQQKKKSKRRRISEATMVNQKKIIRLCNVARFTDSSDQRTCFQIHHQSPGNYPPLPCDNSMEPEGTEDDEDEEDDEAGEAV